MTDPYEAILDEAVSVALPVVVVSQPRNTTNRLLVMLIHECRQLSRQADEITDELSSVHQKLRELTDMIENR